MFQVVVTPVSPARQGYSRRRGGNILAGRAHCGPCVGEHSKPVLIFGVFGVGFELQARAINDDILSVEGGDEGFVVAFDKTGNFLPLRVFSVIFSCVNYFERAVVIPRGNKNSAAKNSELTAKPAPVKVTLVLVGVEKHVLAVENGFYSEPVGKLGAGNAFWQFQRALAQHKLPVARVENNVVDAVNDVYQPFVVGLDERLKGVHGFVIEFLKCKVYKF